MFPITNDVVEYETLLVGLKLARKIKAKKVTIYADSQNNVVEYKTLLLGLKLARKIRAKKVMIYANSQLVTRQVSKEYEVGDPHLKKYHELIGQIWKDFIDIQMVQISREKNYETDELSRLNTSDSTKIVRILVEYIDLPSTMAESEVLIINPLD